MYGFELGGVDRVLDFGCGCGRTLRWLADGFPTTSFYGADVDAGAIQWCARNLPRSTFVHSRLDPPLPFEPGFFDSVYCFSVFTHLDEPMQDIWLSELKRVLKPGGILILTVHGERACGPLGKQGSEILRRRGFVHKRSHKLQGIVPDWYNTTWHSRTYIVDRIEKRFTDVRYTTVPDGTQDLVSARSPFTAGAAG